MLSEKVTRENEWAWESELCTDNLKREGEINCYERIKWNKVNVGRRERVKRENTEKLR